MVDIFPAHARNLPYGIASLWQIVTTALRIASPKAGEASRVVEEATLREFDRLDDERLKDIGIRRKPKRVRWLELGRGMAPAPVLEFDYFRLDR